MLDNPIPMSDLMTVLLFLASMIQLYNLLHGSSKKSIEEQEEREKTQEKENLELHMMIKQISDNIAELKDESKGIHDLVNSDHERLVVLEQHQKTMWKRIDELNAIKVNTRNHQ